MFRSVQHRLLVGLFTLTAFFLSTAFSADAPTEKLAKPALSVLMGYLHFAVIYRKNPVGLPAPKALKIDGDVNALNQLLQEIAWDAVTHHPLSGVVLDAQGSK